MPIFMIGTQRSGSNLLRLMLNELPDIAAPHPPHILQRMMPLVPLYGDLNKDENFASLVDDVCQLVELNPVPWEGVALNRAEVADICRERSVVAAFGAVYDIMAHTWRAKTWCCKSLANIGHLDEIERYFGADAKYIYLYRDGRDVAVSFRKAVVGEKHYYHIAKEWSDTQRLGLGLRDKIDSARLISVSYEEITGKPEPTMRRLCDFLGQPFSSAMLEFHKSEEAKRAAGSSDLWGNVARPLMSDNTQKFRREATAEDIRIFESVAGDVLDALDYERVSVPRGHEVRFSEQELRKFDEENQRFKAEVLAQIDAEDLKRRDRQAQLLNAIKARCQAERDVHAAMGQTIRVKSSNIVRHSASVTRQRREQQNGHRGAVVWFTGLSGSGKSTIAHAVEEVLHGIGCRTFVIDGDNMRHGLCADLGFSAKDRSENIRRMGEMVKLLTELGIIGLGACISPFEKDRARARKLVGDSDFIEIYCRCPLEVCEQRDIKGHYRRARAGEIADFTGVSSPYEEPKRPDLVLDTENASLQDCVEQVIELLKRRDVIPRGQIQFSMLESPARHQPQATTDHHL